MRRGKRRNYAIAITQIANAFLHYLLQCMIYIHTIYLCVCVSVLDANVSRRTSKKKQQRLMTLEE